MARLQRRLSHNGPDPDLPRRLAPRPGAGDEPPLRGAGEPPRGPLPRGPAGGHRGQRHRRPVGPGGRHRGTRRRPHPRALPPVLPRAGAERPAPARAPGASPRPAGRAARRRREPPAHRDSAAGRHGRRRRDPLRSGAGDPGVAALLRRLHLLPGPRAGAGGDVGAGRGLDGGGPLPGDQARLLRAVLDDDGAHGAQHGHPRAHRDRLPARHRGRRLAAGPRQRRPRVARALFRGRGMAAFRADPGRPQRRRAGLPPAPPDDGDPDGERDPERLGHPDRLGEREPEPPLARRAGPRRDADDRPGAEPLGLVRPRGPRRAPARRDRPAPCPAGPSGRGRRGPHVTGSDRGALAGDARPARRPRRDDRSGARDPRTGGGDPRRGPPARPGERGPGAPRPVGGIGALRAADHRSGSYGRYCGLPREPVRDPR